MFLIPKAVRRGYRKAMFLYWDPVLDVWDSIKEMNVRKGVLYCKWW